MIKKNYYISFTLYFLGFGVIVALLTSIIDYNYNVKRIEHEFQSRAKQETDFKKKILQHYISKNEMLLSSILNNELTLHFLEKQNTANQKNINQLFFALSYANEDIMQLRYIDSSGMEIIRIERSKKLKNIIISPKNKMQNKKLRYYFAETSQLEAGQFWHSNIDLNIEHGKIEKPLKPTFRLATPVFLKGKFQGIIIVNLLFEKTLNILSNSSNFYIYLIDKKGEIIQHPKQDKSWSKYLPNQKNLFYYFPDKAKNILNSDYYYTKELYSFSFGNLFKNNENLKILFTPKSLALKKVENKNIYQSIFIAIIVLVVSIPLSWLISIIPSNLQLKLATANEEIKKLSITDSLTGLYNRHKLEEVLAQEVARTDRYKCIFSIIIIDIDFFKKVNDNYGHLTGDAVLIHIANILKDNARKTDFVSRWGGEEFLIVASESDLENTYTFAEKLRKIINNYDFPTVKDITISCGVATYCGNESTTELIARADKALYEAKNSGRNTVCKN